MNGEMMDSEMMLWVNDDDEVKMRQMMKLEWVLVEAEMDKNSLVVLAAVHSDMEIIVVVVV